MSRRKTLTVSTFPWVLTGALGALTCCSFAISYSALAEFARANQIALPLLWPLIIDGAITMSSVVALRSTLEGRSGRGYFVTASVMTVVSVALNIAHVWQGAAVSHLVLYAAHAIAPTMTLVLCDILLRQVAHSARAVRTVVVGAGSGGTRRRSPGSPERALTREAAFAAVQQHGSRRAAARALGCAWRTLQRALD